MRSLLICLLAGVTSPASAMVEVRFQDSDPWDYFDISTATDCPIVGARLTIDMTTSVAGVVVDTEYGGLGTKDPMPVEVERGEVALDTVNDGAQILDLRISKLAQDLPVRLQMDVDDTLSFFHGDRIVVDPSEMAEASVTFTYDGQTTTGSFDANGIAIVPLPASTVICGALVS